jgi:hypothetical protein
LPQCPSPIAAPIRIPLLQRGRGDVIIAVQRLAAKLRRGDVVSVVVHDVHAGDVILNFELR